ncbi:hypothetical protein E2R68_01880 [Psychromonas sp. RZ22]|uniref:hypothetical protein n=1 Tax=Psychromonas algarum TaxID=2555643 RepID=UPI001067729F|nr:hypothetical protein [Psychromonas sp. RZ22]TEW56808.1 hypothetical protein E2R68_01880 [Psychromonas sp. RZ22]
MKFFTLIFALLLSSQAFAHPGHGMEDGLSHLFFHAVFWVLFTAVIVKAVVYFKHKKSKKS